jgi:hypothetical protein
MTDIPTPPNSLKSHGNILDGPSAGNGWSTAGFDSSDSSWATGRIAELEAALSRMRLEREQEKELWEKQLKEQQDQLVKRQADLEAREFEVRCHFVE